MATTIPTLPPAPSRANDTPEQFSNKADALLGALSGFVTNANAQAGENNTSATNAAASAASAGTSASSATASAASATASQTAAAISASAAEAFAQQASGTAISSGTANAVAYLDSNKYLKATSDLTYNGSQLGVPAGTVSNPSLTTTGDTNTGLYFPAADTVAIATGGVKRVEVDASGNLGVATTTPTSRLHVKGSFRIESDATQWFSMGAGSTAASVGGFYKGGTTTTVGSIGTDGGGIVGGGTGDNFGIRAESNLLLMAGATERARITSEGNLLVGYTASNGAYKLQVNSQIFATSSTIATSDGRYKENIKPIDGALNLVKAFNPVQFVWKEHPVHAFDTETPTVGFIAQELQQVLADKPYLNSIVKRNECTIIAAEYETIEIEPAEEEIKDENGNVLMAAKPAITEERLIKPAVIEEFLGIAEGNLIAILTKAIKEQQAIIESLTARITALEAK